MQALGLHCHGNGHGYNFLLPLRTASRNNSLEEKASHFLKCEIPQALSMKDRYCPEQERAQWRRQCYVCCSKATVANAKDHSKAVFYYLRSL